MFMCISSTILKEYHEPWPARYRKAGSKSGDGCSIESLREGMAAHFGARGHAIPLVM